MRPTDVPDTGLLCDLLWSDPDKDIVGWGEVNFHSVCAHEWWNRFRMFRIGNSREYECNFVHTCGACEFVRARV